MKIVSKNSLTCGVRAQSAPSKKIKNPEEKPQCPLLLPRNASAIGVNQFFVALSYRNPCFYFKYYPKPFAIIENDKNKFPTVLGHRANIGERQQKIHNDIVVCAVGFVCEKKKTNKKNNKKWYVCITRTNNMLCGHCMLPQITNWYQPYICSIRFWIIESNKIETIDSTTK